MYLVSLRNGHFGFTSVFFAEETKNRRLCERKLEIDFNFLHGKLNKHRFFQNTGMCINFQIFQVTEFVQKFKDGAAEKGKILKTV